MDWKWRKKIDSLPPTRARPQSGLLQTAFSLVGERGRVGRDSVAVFFDYSLDFQNLDCGDEKDRLHGVWIHAHDWPSPLGICPRVSVKRCS